MALLRLFVPGLMKFGSRGGEKAEGERKAAVGQAGHETS